MKTIELFAGVGGFRLALENANQTVDANYDIVWSNQWEPATKTQHASDLYIKRFGKKGHSNNDIAQVILRDFNNIPDHDLLVGGFPCQDYSVAKSLKYSTGIEGKKGVLWWSIHDILSKKGDQKPNYLLLENVDRLLSSPASQRGRDFAIILASLNDLGYAVEWRVINAADYGFPQQRRRVYIIGYHKSSNIYKQISQSQSMLNWLTQCGTIASVFPVCSEDNLLLAPLSISGSLTDVSDNFGKQKSKSDFYNCGIAIDRQVWTLKTKALYSGKRTLLQDILISDDLVSKDFWIEDNALERWRYLKGAKNEMRTNSAGFKYKYNEGQMSFPDALDKPARTIITGEGGKSPSRFKHVIQTPSGKFRRLHPIELERVNMFPDNHTEGVSDVKRAFLMGNALVVGVVQKLGESLFLKHKFND